MNRRLKTEIPFFVHPLPLSAVGLMALNDHYLKYKIPGMFTGKLSDFAGLFYFPLFMAAVWVLMGIFLGRKIAFHRNLLIFMIVLTDVLFAIFKLNQYFADQFSMTFSAVFFPIRIVSDPTDLFALMASGASYLFGKRYFVKPTNG